MHHHNRFDCFITYNSKDAWWVFNELLPKLGKQNLQLQDDMSQRNTSPRFDFCLHDFHFRPGTAIVDNIVEAIVTSRCTLLFITKRYVCSNWCQFEAKMAHSHIMSEHRRKVIAVVHPDIIPMRKGRLPLGLDALQSTVTYLEWPRHEQGRKVFWVRLEQALSG